MSEHLTIAPGPDNKHEILSSGETVELLAANAERSEKESAAANKEPHLKLNEVRKHVNETVKADRQSDPLAHLKSDEKAAQPTPPAQQSQELRQVTLRRELSQIRRKLPAPQRVLSKVIHQPAVRAVSEVAGKTVSRPSGLLGGGIVALSGTSAYLYLAKHIGFSYNYGVFLVLFVGGFMVGIALELMVHAMTTSQRHSE